MMPMEQITRVVGGVTYNLTYDAENRMTGVSGGATATFVYDGEGKRVKGMEEWECFSFISGR